MQIEFRVGSQPGLLKVVVFNERAAGGLWPRYRIGLIERALLMFAFVVVTLQIEAQVMEFLVDNIGFFVTA